MKMKGQSQQCLEVLTDDELRKAADDEAVQREAKEKRPIIFVL